MKDFAEKLKDLAGMSTEHLCAVLDPQRPRKEKLMNCEWPDGCENDVPASRGRKPRRFCDGHNTNTARQKLSRKKKSDAQPIRQCGCVLVTRGRKCPQHRNGGHRPNDQNIWWMPHREIAGFLHNQPPWKWGNDDRGDLADLKLRQEARRNQPEGSPRWRTDAGAQAPAQLKGPFRAVKPSADDYRRLQKLEADDGIDGIGRGYLHPLSNPGAWIPDRGVWPPLAAPGDMDITRRRRLGNGPDQFDKETA